MDNPTQEQIETLIKFIDEAEDPATVTNTIVAAVLRFLADNAAGTASAQPLLDEIAARQAADTNLSNSITQLQQLIQNIGTVVYLDSMGRDLDEGDVRPDTGMLVYDPDNLVIKKYNSPSQYDIIAPNEKLLYCNLVTGYFYRFYFGFGMVQVGGGGSVIIVDNLTSTSTIAALSAKQGKVLSGIISALNADLTGRVEDIEQTITESDLPYNRAVVPLKSMTGYNAEGFIFNPSAGDMWYDGTNIKWWETGASGGVSVAKRTDVVYLHTNTRKMYRWNGNTMQPLNAGSTASAITYDPTESGLEADDVQAAIDTLNAEKVPSSRKINNHALTGDITLSASDVGAVSASGNIVPKFLNDLQSATAEQINSLNNTIRPQGVVDASGIAGFANGVTLVGGRVVYYDMAAGDNKTVSFSGGTPTGNNVVEYTLIVNTAEADASPQITFPSTILWAATPSIAQGKIYEISILWDGKELLGVCAEFTPPTEDED